MTDPQYCSHMPSDRLRDTYTNGTREVGIRELCKNCGTVLIEHTAKPPDPDHLGPARYSQLEEELQLAKSMAANLELVVEIMARRLGGRQRISDKELREAHGAVVLWRDVSEDVLYVEVTAND